MSSKKLPEKKIFSLGERILIVKDDHGLNNSNFAESLGWTSSQVTKYTKNQDTPGFEKLLDLNRVYNVILHWLITGIGDKYFTSPELFTIKYARPLINDSSQEYTFHAPAAAPNDHPADQQITGQFPTAEQIAQAQTRERAKQSWLGCLTVNIICGTIFLWLKYC